MFTDLAERAGAPDPVSLGRQLHLLYDGAANAARMDRSDSGIAQPTRNAPETLAQRGKDPSPPGRVLNAGGSPGPGPQQPG
jgi:hypothetical protein